MYRQYLQKMKNLANSCIVLIIAILLFAVCAPFGVLFALCRRRWHIDYASAILRKIAVSIDQLGNVAFAGFLNAVMVRGIKPFGLEDDTVSEVMERNKDHLTGIGKMIARILEKLDQGHMEKALEENMHY